jgi:hypothetical protein
VTTSPHSNDQVEVLKMKAVYDEVNYVLNDSGEIDVNHYISKAHNLRSEAIRSYSLKVSGAGIAYIASLFQNTKAA